MRIARECGGVRSRVNGQRAMMRQTDRGRKMAGQCQVDESRHDQRVMWCDERVDMWHISVGQRRARWNASSQPARFPPAFLTNCIHLNKSTPYARLRISFRTAS